MNSFLDEYQVEYTEVRTIGNQIAQGYSNIYDWIYVMILTGVIMLVTSCFVSFMLGRRYENEIKKREEMNQKIPSEQFWNYRQYLKWSVFMYFVRSESSDQNTCSTDVVVRNSFDKRESDEESVGNYDLIFKDNEQIIVSASRSNRSRSGSQDSVETNQKYQQNMLSLKNSQKNNQDSNQIVQFNSLGNQDNRLAIKNGQKNHLDDNRAVQSRSAGNQECSMVNAKQMSTDRLFDEHQKMPDVINQFQSSMSVRYEQTVNYDKNSGKIMKVMNMIQVKEYQLDEKSRKYFESQNGEQLISNAYNNKAVLFKDLSRDIGLEGRDQKVMDNKICEANESQMELYQNQNKCQNKVYQNEKQQMLALEDKEQKQIEELFSHQQNYMFESDKLWKTFINCQLIGQGGYGEVFKAEHRLDQQLYAIKRVYFSIEKDEMVQSHRYLREVQAMFKLQHTNIVRYYCLWIEELDKEIQKKVYRKRVRSYSVDDGINEQWDSSDSEQKGTINNDNDTNYILDEQQSSQQNNLSQLGFQWENNSDQCQDSETLKTQKSISKYSQIRFQRNSSSNKNSGIIQFKQSRSVVEDSITQNRDLLKLIENNLMKQKTTLVLNIQMQFCDGSSLQEYLKTRKGNISRKTNIDILRQLLDGMQFIHSNRIIHRDIKQMIINIGRPANIFIDKKSKILIGDFGLAKMILKDTMEVSEPIKDLIENQQQHTLGIGTPMYLAPEIENGQSYCNKVDIYALGLVLLELISDIRTDHERYQIMNGFKKQNYIDELVVSSFSAETELVRWMTSYDQNQRPNIEEIIESRQWNQLSGLLQ